MYGGEGGKERGINTWSYFVTRDMKVLRDEKGSKSAAPALRFHLDQEGPPTAQPLFASLKKGERWETSTTHCEILPKGPRRLKRTVRTSQDTKQYYNVIL